MSRGPKPTHKITLSAKEHAELKHIARLRTAPYAEVVRAKVIVTAYEHPDWSNQQIARAIGCTFRTVRKWRHRWRSTGSLEDAERLGGPRFFSL